MPESVTGQQRFFVSELVEILVFARKEGQLQVIIVFGAPFFGYIINITVNQPFGQVEQGLIGGKLPQIVAEEDIVNQNAGNSLADLFTQLRVVAIENGRPVVRESAR